MCRFIETMKFAHGSIDNLGFHQKRVNRAFTEYFSGHSPIQLKDINIPDNWKDRVGKCRIVYNRDIIKIDFSQSTIFKITSLKIVESPALDYKHKYEDRSQLEKLYHKRGTADEVIISLDGRITDSFYANLAFYSGEKWYTPMHPLLKGTKRQQLLEAGKLIEEDLKVDDIHNFQEVSLINAMLDLGQVSVKINQVY